MIKIWIGILPYILGALLLPQAVHTQNRQADHPLPFEHVIGSPSVPVRLLLSERGQQLLRQSSHPKARALRRWLEEHGLWTIRSAPEEDGTETTTVAPEEPVLLLPDESKSLRRDDGVVSTACGTAYGTQFNLESRRNAKPQPGQQSIDFLRNRLGSGVDLIVGGSHDYRGSSGRFGGSDIGYYVSRNADCTPEFEGGLPKVAGLSGEANPVVAADPDRDAFFMAGLYSAYDDNSGSYISGIGVFRSSTATLLSSTTCPNGTHTAAQAVNCWPTKTLLLKTYDPPYVDQPRLAVDERKNGRGAGNVYIVVQESQFPFGSGIQLVSCTNDLALCSTPLLISGTDSEAALPDVALRPDGDITITWINKIGVGGESFEIKYRACAPANAPATPTCGTTALVHTETLALSGGLAAQAFQVTTYPKHDHRVDTNGTETYVIWDRCKISRPSVACPDADVVMKASRNNGATWSALTCVACNSQDQFFPAIRTDRSRQMVNIALYSSAKDTTFQHRIRVILYHIAPGSATPDPPEPHTITTLQNDPSGDPVLGGSFFGGYLGMAARGTGTDNASRAYVHFTYNNIQGTYNGIAVPEPNNHLSRLDY